MLVPGDREKGFSAKKKKFLSTETIRQKSAICSLDYFKSVELYPLPTTGAATTDYYFLLTFTTIFKIPLVSSIEEKTLVEQQF